MMRMQFLRNWMCLKGKNYDLYLYDSSHNEIAKSIKTAGERSLSSTELLPDDYYLKVVGNGDSDEDQEYTLSWTRWFVNPANGHFYKLHEGGDWQTCEQEAIDKYGAYLVTINNGDEQDWLTDIFGGSARYWIGYTDKDEEGDWKWISGETSSYTNWNTGRTK
ncbi:MAG: lectin-like protein [Candidatus Brocadiaceae bacterium]